MPRGIYNRQKNMPVPGEEVQEQPKKRGAPRKVFYETKYQEILDAYSKGYGTPRIAKILNCTIQRVNQLAKEDPNLFSVLEKGKALAQDWWETQGLKALKDRRFNSSLYALFMSNKFGWSGKNKIELESKNETQTTIKFDKPVVDALVDKLLESD